MQPQGSPLLENVNAIKQSIENIFSTSPGQRFFNPEFGVDLTQFLFELVDDVTTLNIESLIRSAVSRWDQRVVFDATRSAITPDPDNNQYILSLYYTIPMIGNQLFHYTGVVVP